MIPIRTYVAAVLLQFASVVLSHNDGGDGVDMDMGDMKMPQAHKDQVGTQEINNFDAPSYYGLDSHANMMMAHIVLMVAAWFFILPLGKIAENSLWKVWY